MSNPKETHELIRQNEQVVKKSQKHDANLQKNSGIYFQIGLIVCLLTVYGLFEMTFKTSLSTYGDLPPLVEPTYADVPIIRPKVPELVEPVKQKVTKQSTEFKEVPDNTPLDVLKEDFKPVEDIVAPVDLSDLILEEAPAEDENVDFIRVEEVPVYPGCESESTNEGRKKCMSDKITKLVQKKFDTSIAPDYGLSDRQKIDVQFTIDKTGHVNQIKTRASHPELEAEARRVINVIPVMTPGKQRDKPVGVIYTLPIIFMVQ